MEEEAGNKKLIYKLEKGFPALWKKYGAHEERIKFL